MRSGVAYVIGNAFADHGSLYGMRAVLSAFIAKALVGHAMQVRRIR